MTSILAHVAALPKTHRVTTVTKDGSVTRHDAHSAASAENYAVRMRRMIESGEAVSVTVEPL